MHDREVRRRHVVSRITEVSVKDIAYLLLVLLFFLATWAYVLLLDRLKGR